MLGHAPLSLQSYGLSVVDSSIVATISGGVITAGQSFDITMTNYDASEFFTGGGILDWVEVWIFDISGGQAMHECAVTTNSDVTISATAPSSIISQLNNAQVIIRRKLTL